MNAKVIDLFFMYFMPICSDSSCYCLRNFVPLDLVFVSLLIQSLFVHNRASNRMKILNMLYFNQIEYSVCFAARFFLYSAVTYARDTCVYMCPRAFDPGSDLCSSVDLDKPS